MERLAIRLTWLISLLALFLVGANVRPIPKTFNCTGVPACETDAAHDTCAEVTGCVENAIICGGVPACETDAAHDTCSEITNCIDITSPTDGDLLLYDNGSWVVISDSATANECLLSGGSGATDPHYATCPGGGGGCTTAAKNFSDGTTSAVMTTCDDTLTLAGAGTASVSCGTKTCTITGSAHTVDTGPSPDCVGTTTYQDGEGTCDTLDGLEDFESATDDGVPVGNGTTFDTKIIPNCTNDTGEGLGYDAATNAWECHTISGGGGGDNISIDSVAVTDPDFVSTGDIDFVDTSNVVTANIKNDRITEAMLKAIDTAVDEECLTYEAAVGDFEWQSCSSGGGGCTNSVQTYATDGTSVVISGCDQTITLAGSGTVSTSGSGSTVTITGSAHTPDEVGAVTNNKICQGDGSQVVCDLQKDVSGECSSLSVCMGGHTHAHVDTTGRTASDHHVQTADQVGTVINGDICQGGASAILDCDVPTDASEECAAGSVCMGGHTHAGGGTCYGHVMGGAAGDHGGCHNDGYTVGQGCASTESYISFKPKVNWTVTAIEARQWGDSSCNQTWYVRDNGANSVISCSTNGGTTKTCTDTGSVSITTAETFSIYVDETTNNCGTNTRSQVIVHYTYACG